MSERTAKRSLSLISPIAIPAIGRLIGTPASINAIDVPQTFAMDDEPFDSVISETIRIVYGNSSFFGSIGRVERQASLPWPISRRRGAPKRPVSPTEYGGKL